MTYEEKLALETANEIFALDLICKRIDEFESRSIESIIQASVMKAMQAQREACAAVYNKYDSDDTISYEELRQAILNAKVKP